MKSQSQHQFSQVPKAEIPRSSFDRSHGYKTAFDGGKLIPIFIDEALPGDTFNLNMTGFARMATPIFPIMDNMYMETQFFAVPLRLLWDNWEKFNGAQDDPDDSTDFTIPIRLNAGGEGLNSVADYFGIPILETNVSYNALPIRAYQLIWNTWYRDQNLQDSVIERTTDDGPDGYAVPVLRRGKRHDYFTSCLPWPQKGDSVALPLGDKALISGIAVPDAEVPAGTSTNRKDATGSGLTYTNKFEFDNDNIIMRSTGSSGSDIPDVYADLSTATAATINQLRQSFQIQKLLERDARGGTRYTEIVKAHFGVTSPDARLQRPEYLGGGSSPINVSAVQQTSSTDGTSPQGNLAAYATATLHNHGFTKSFTEHCYIIGLVSVRADLTYQQGLDRLWSRQTRYDFFWPALATIGEQAVLNKEIFATGGANDELVFGYQERYAEYRYKPSKITGIFRSAAPTPLDAWHLAQDFATLPTLGDTFIQDTPPIDRVIAVPTEPHFLFDSYFSLRCARPMPMYGIPGNMDRF